MTIEPRHIALWLKANELTRPAVDEKPPTYGAWHRQRAERVVEREPEADHKDLHASGLNAQSD